jgi:VanZ family protein
MLIRTRSFFPAILWLTIITVLFLLPGSDFPDEDWFHKVYLDKWVHSGFFFLLVDLFQRPLLIRKTSPAKWMAFVTTAAVFYGIAIEFIQKWWISGRSFDVLDMVFDSIGAIAAYWAGRQWLKKVGKK